mgnify:FL=1
MSPKYPRKFLTPIDYGYHPSWIDRSYVQQRKNPTFRQLQGKYELQQSELARPWLNEGPYLEMEYDPLVPWWPLPWLFPPDGPWIGPDPYAAIGGNFHLVFRAWTNDCYEDGETTEITIHSTYPITSLSKSAGETGYTLSTVNEDAQIYSVTVDEGKENYLYLICIMTIPPNDQGLPVGYQGRATVVVDSCVGIDCSACTGISWDDGTSATSVDQDDSCTVAITDGNDCGPYSWSVTGSGLTLENASTSGLTNTLNAAADACGPAEITVTDACDNTATGSVACTTGTWTTYCDGDKPPSEPGCAPDCKSDGLGCWAEGPTIEVYTYGTFWCDDTCDNNDTSCNGVFASSIITRYQPWSCGDSCPGATICKPQPGVLTTWRFWECS